MSQVVWKEKLRGQLREPLKIVMPTRSKIVRVGIAPDGEPSIWFVCDPANKETEERWFVIAFTGHQVADDAEHIGMWWEASFVFHAFELKSDPALLVNVLGEEEETDEGGQDAQR